MNFTQQESKLVERLRKQDRRWRWARWVVVVMGVLFTALCTAFGYLLHRLIAESDAGHFDGQTVFFIVLFWTKCCVYLFFAVWCFVTAWLKWHGDVNRLLLLKLLDEKQKVV
jgi:uncharacterized BrkB/YihY/UPF0761 family membrane protein